MEFSTLVGKTLKTVTTEGVGGDEILFECESGETYKMCHYQDCCESCSINEIHGDLADLIGSPILLAEESTNSDENPEGYDPGRYQESFTWTFYRMTTIKGSVQLRWLGESNGYYSEGVDFVQVTP